jgi:hypothetical protein
VKKSEVDERLNYISISEKVAKELEDKGLFDEIPFITATRRYKVVFEYEGEFKLYTDLSFWNFPRYSKQPEKGLRLSNIWPDKLKIRYTVVPNKGKFNH